MTSAGQSTVGNNDSMSTLDISTSEEDLREALSTASFPVSFRRRIMHPYYGAIQGDPNDNDLGGLVVKLDGSPIAVMLGATSEQGERVEFSYFGDHARLELANDRVMSLGDNIIKALSKEILGFLDARAARIELKTRNPDEAQVLVKLLERAKSHQVCFEAIAKPAPDGDLMLRSFRSFHRQRVKQGIKVFDQDLQIHFGSLDQDLADSYRELHAHVAGRKTRPASSWQEMTNAVRAKNALLVTAFYEGKLVGGTFTWIGIGDALYGTGAYDRALFKDFPISHALIFRSLEVAGELGLSEYVLGEAFSIGGSDKEKGIALFKRGFAHEVHQVHQFVVA